MSGLSAAVLLALAVAGTARLAGAQGSVRSAGATCPSAAPPTSFSDASSAQQASRAQVAQARAQCSTGLGPQSQSAYQDTLATIEADTGTCISAGVSPPEWGACVGAEYVQLTRVYERVAYADVSTQLVESSLGGGMAGSGSGLLVPDPNVGPNAAELAWTQVLKRQDGRLATGTAAERVRTVVAENFERLVRVYVGGSAQLERDGWTPIVRPGLGGARLRVRGLYEGYQPDLLNAGPTGGVLEGPYDPDWGRCSSGVVNTANRWFRSRAGGAAGPESLSGNTLANHRCAATRMVGRSEFPLNRGRMVHQMMLAMERIRDSIRNTGRIPTAAEFGAGGSGCERYWAEATGIRGLPGGSRSVLRGIRSEILTQIQDPRTLAQRASECFEPLVQTPGAQAQAGFSLTDRQLAATGDRRATTRTLVQNQIRVCHLLNLQILSEVELPTRYAYCVWKSAADRIRREMTRALIP